jgi:hypothetical protein
MKLRSEQWWNDPSNPGMTALYLERFLNYGLAPCNRAHLQTVTIPPSLPDAHPRSDRPARGGRESKFLAANT